MAERSSGVPDRGTANDTRDRDRNFAREFARATTETKAFSKTSEIIIWAVTVAAVLIAAAIVDGFGATEAWRYVTYLSVAYLISRGLAKAGSPEPNRN